MVELSLELATGGSDGAPGQVTQVSSLRFKRQDDALVNEEAPVISPSSGSVLTYEKWVRVWAVGDPPNRLTNLKFWRVSGTTSKHLTERYGEVPQASGYQRPSDASRLALTAVPTSPTLLSEDNHDYPTGDQQIGPWLVLQWEIGVNTPPGPQGPVVYRISVDEY